MRKIMRKLFFFGFIIALFIGIFQPQEWLEEDEKSKYTRLANGARNKITYLMSQKEWILFSIPSFATQLKFLSTANIRPHIDDEEALKQIRYSLVYEFLDKNNKVLFHKEYHFRTSFVRFQDKEGTFVEKNFYVDTPLHPNSSQALFLSLKEHKDASQIRLKIQSKDPFVVDVGIRSYYLEPTSPSRRKTTWKRMSKERKSHLARGNVYEVSHLTAQEKYQLVSALWKPNGPIGIKDKAYRVRRLFIHPDPDNIHPYVPFVPTIYSDENLSASRKLPEGNYSIELRNLSKNTLDKNDYNNSVFLTLYQDVLKVHSRHYQIQSKSKTIDINLDSEMLLDINSSQALSIVIKDKAKQEILNLPPLISSEYYKIEANQSIHYDFYHPHLRFLRIECRSHEDNVSTLSLQMKTSLGKIKEETYTIHFEPYRYDYIKPFIAQSKAFYLYIALPKDIKSLSLSPSSPMLLRLSTRSQTMLYPIYSFSKDRQKDFKRLLPWFTLRPRNFDTEILSMNKTSLYKQPPPPSINPFIALGHYAYEQLLPQERWYGHSLLLKRPLGENYIRPQSWSSIYAKLDTNRSNNIIFQDDVGRKEVLASLLYINHSPSLFPSEIYLNNALLLRHVLHGTSAPIALPPLPLKQKHILDFSQTKDTDFFINYFAKSKEVFLKRKFIAFDKKFHFRFYKSHALESLGFQLAMNKYEDNASLLVSSFRVQISHTAQANHQAYFSYSFRNYILHADTTQEEALHISAKNTSLSLSSPLYLKLGENLPIGEYTITVCPPQIPYKTYLFVNHLILDEKANTRITKEIL